MHNVESLTWVKGPEEKVAKPIGRQWVGPQVGVHGGGPTWVKRRARTSTSSVGVVSGVHITGDLTAYAHEIQIQEYRKILGKQDGKSTFCG